MRKYYAIVVDYAGCNYHSHEVLSIVFDYAGCDCHSHEVLAIYLSENKAKQEFKKAVEEHFKPLYYNKNTDMVYEDSDTCYNIGIYEFYDQHHLCVRIQEVSGNWRYGIKFFDD